MANSKPSCFFCGSKRQSNLILVGEDALGNMELIDRDMQEKKEVVAIRRVEG